MHAHRGRALSTRVALPARPGMTRLVRYWYRMRSSFWFLPALIVAGATALAFFMIEVDARYVTSGLLDPWPRVFGAGSGASRSLLTTIASSMITVAGTVFSITLVALSLASSQYSSRVLRNFMRDRTNQTVLGVFVGIFAYCIVVLRSIYGSGDDAFLPSIAVLLGLVLGFGGIFVLVFFIHHISQSIQASQILDAVRLETCHAVQRLFPNHAREEPGPDAGAEPADWHEARRADATGYLQFIDFARLCDLAVAHGVRLDMRARIGDYVLEGDPLLFASPAPPPGLGDAAADCWSVGVQRTLEQDVAFGIRQLVDVALKALSPGINDTTTAVMCIDALTAILAALAGRDLRFHGCERDGTTWVQARHPAFADLLDEAFEQIRHCAGDNVVVLERLGWALSALAERAGIASRRNALYRHATRLEASARTGMQEPHDRETLAASTRRLIQQLGQPLA